MASPFFVLAGRVAEHEGQSVWVREKARARHGRREKEFVGLL